MLADAVVQPALLEPVGAIPVDAVIEQDASIEESVLCSSCAECPEAEYITVSETKEIKAKAFMGCKALKTVIVPEGITKIRPEAFDGYAPCRLRATEKPHAASPLTSLTSWRTCPNLALRVCAALVNRTCVRARGVWVGWGVLGREFVLALPAYAAYVCTGL